MKKYMYIFILVLTLSIVVSGCSQGNASSDNSSEYPTEDMDLTIAFGPGGGNDLLARTLIDILYEHDLYPENIVPTNRDGGSGAVGWGYLNDQQGDPYNLSTTSGSFITTPLQSNPGWTYEDFTHIALMATDDLMLVVNDDSEYEKLDEIIEDGQENKIVIGGIGAANVQRMVVETLKTEHGVEFEYVPFNEEGQLLAGLTSNSLDMVLTFPNGVLGQLESGDVKAIAYTGEERLSDFPELPTFIEEGYDISFPMPRGIILPADVDDNVREYWIETMKKVSETEEWSDYIEKNNLTEHQLYGDDFSEYLTELSDDFERILGDLELLE